MEKRKNVRNLKVYEQSGHNYKSTPAIMLKGLWLKELGDESALSESGSSSIFTTDLGVPTLRYLFCVIYPSAITLRLW